MAESAAQQVKDQAQLNELLSWAAARGLLADAEELIGRGAEPTAHDKQGRCPAHYAAAHGHADVLQFLAAKGADLEAEDAAARTPLHHAAAAAGHAPAALSTDALAYLIKQSAWLNAPDAGDNTPLHLAARCGWVPAIKLLLAGGATIDAPNKQGLSALGEAVAAGHEEAAQALLAAGAAPTWRADGYTLLHVAAGLGRADTLRLLLGEPLMGALVNDARNADRATPLHAAALAASLPAAELLLSRGADAGVAGAGGLLAWQLAELAPQQQLQLHQGLHEQLQQPHDPVQAKKAAAATAAQAARQQQDAQRLTQVLKQAAGGKGAAAAGSGQGALGAAAAASGGAAAASMGPTEVYSQRFRQLSGAEQERRVEALARMSVPEIAQLATISKAAKAAIGQVRRANQLLAVYAAVAALRADEAFQEGASDPAVQEALADMGRHNNMEKYAADRQVVSVANKLKKFHSLMQECGGVKLGLPDLLIAPGASLQQLTQQDAAHVDGLRRAATEARAAAVAAIAGGVAGGGGRSAGAPTAVSVAGGCEIQPADPTSPTADTELDRELQRHRRDAAAAAAVRSGGGARGSGGVDLESMTFKQRMLYEVVESFKRAVKIVGGMVLLFALMYFLGLLSSQQEPAALDARMRKAMMAAQQQQQQMAAAAEAGGGDAGHGGEL